MICARFRSEHAQKERFLRHFEAEDRDWFAIAHGNIFGDVERERRLPHRRARRENYKLGWLQARGFVIESSVTGGEARDAPAFAENAFQALEIVSDKFFDTDKAGAHAIFSNLEDGGFGAIEDDVGVITAGEGLFLNCGGGEGEIAEDGFFFDDARVVLHVRRAREAVGQLRQIGDAAGGI